MYLQDKHIYFVDLQHNFFVLSEPNTLNHNLCNYRNLNLFPTPNINTNQQNHDSTMTIQKHNRNHARTTI